MATKGSDTTGATMLGQQSSLPASPDEAVLERVPIRTPTRNMWRALRCLNLPQSVRLLASQILPILWLIMCPTNFWLRAKASNYSWPVFATMALFTKIARCWSPNVSSPVCSRSGCALAAIGIRAAAFRLMCFGKQVNRRSGCLFPTKACHPIAAAKSLSD